MLIPKSLSSGDNYTRTAAVCPKTIETTLARAIPKVYQYAQKNHMTTLALYYETPKSPNALFAAPNNIYIENENKYVKKILRINSINLNNDNPKGPIIDVSSDNINFKVDGSTLESLLTKGEENIYVNDLIGNIKGVDFMIPGMTSAKSYEIICQSLMIDPDSGDITDNNSAIKQKSELLEISWLELGFIPSQQIIDNFFFEDALDHKMLLMQKEDILSRLNALKEQVPEQMPSIRKELKNYLQLLQKYNDQIKNIISAKIDMSSQLTKKYYISSGLFAFLKDCDFIFTPTLGSGSHSAFFNYYTRKIFGQLIPLSFIDIIRIKNDSGLPLSTKQLSEKQYFIEQLSKDIYKYLLSQKILNKKGFIKNRLSYALLPAQYQKYISENNFNNYFKDTNSYSTVLAKYILNNLNAPRIKEILQALGLSAKIDILKLKDLGNILKKIFSQINKINSKKIDELERHIEALIEEIIDKYASYNRGLIQKDIQGNILILFYDRLEKTAEYYSTIINQIKVSLALDPKTNIKIAYAYKNPSPRIRPTNNNAMDELINYLLKIIS